MMTWHEQVSGFAANNIQVAVELVANRQFYFQSMATITIWPLLLSSSYQFTPHLSNNFPFFLFFFFGEESQQYFHFSVRCFFFLFFLQRPSLYTTQKCRSGVFELTCIRHKSEKQRTTQITVMNLAKKLSGSGNDRISKIFGPGKTGNPIAKLVSQLIQF